MTLDELIRYIRDNTEEGAELTVQDVTPNDPDNRYFGIFPGWRYKVSAEKASFFSDDCEINVVPENRGKELSADSFLEWLEYFADNEFGRDTSVRLALWDSEGGAMRVYFKDDSTDIQSPDTNIISLSYYTIPLGKRWNDYLVKAGEAH